jgi:hypothetical protein
LVYGEVNGIFSGTQQFFTVLLDSLKKEKCTDAVGCEAWPLARLALGTRKDATSM